MDAANLGTSRRVALDGSPRSWIGGRVRFYCARVGGERDSDSLRSAPRTSGMDAWASGHQPLHDSGLRLISECRPDPRLDTR